MRLHLVLLGLCLILLLVSVEGRKKKRFKPTEAVPTQIEPPPDTTEDPDDDDDDDELEEAATTSMFDLDYIVNRPTGDDNDDDDSEEDDDDDDEELPWCDYSNDHGGEGDQGGECRERNLTPYKSYKGYKKWTSRPLLVIMIGGLRWDYLTPSYWNMTQMAGDRLKAFEWIKKHGTTLGQVIPVFPPYDLPVWTSMATGLYPDKTGVVGDYMFNLKSRELFNREEADSSLENWWGQGDPIWSLAAKHNKKVSVLNWLDCDLPGKSLDNPDDCKPFEITEKKKTRQHLIRMLNRAITRIHKDNYDLSMVYIDTLKRVAKEYGPNSPETMDELALIDQVLQGRLSDIKTKKERADLKLNILLVSDYGLNGVEKTTKIVLDDYLEFNHTQFIIQRGGSCVLVPFALRAGDIMRGFPAGNKLGVANMVGVTAYVRDVNLEIPPLEYDEIPDFLNYDGLTWTQDILLVAKPGFEIVINTDSPKVLPPLNDDLGISGFIPNPHPPFIVPGREKHKSKELRAREKHEVELYDLFSHMMKTIGFAWGPDFKAGHSVDSLEIVDIYQLMCFLLKIPPNSHDGDWDRVKDMLVISSSPSVTITPVVMFLSIFITALGRLL